MGAAGDSETLRLHASCVAWNDRAVLITGASGRGKSTLALQLMAYGCTLVSDDQTMLHRQHKSLIPKPTGTIAGQIEARGIGILNANHTTQCHIALVVDLDHISDSRLPPQRSVTYLNVEVPLIYGTGYANFSASVLQILKAGLRTA